MRKILVINRLGIGDVVLTTPLAKLIKDNMDARIGYVVASKGADLLKQHPYIDDVFPYSKKAKKTILQDIKAKGYEEAIIVDERLSSTLLAWKAGCRLLNKGFEVTIGKKRLFQRPNHEIKAIEDFASYSRLLGIDPQRGELKAEVGAVDTVRAAFVSDWLAEIKKKTSKIILVVPKTAVTHKNWNTGELAKFNIYLNEKGIRPIYIGSNSDRPYIDAIAGEKINAAGEFGLRELPLLAKEAAFALAMCTGPLHIIATTAVPILAIYGPTDPGRWAPATAIPIQSSLSCVPCQRWADCPKPLGERCMDEIKFDRVREIMDKFL